jgi:hypothetical protein
MGQYTKKGLYNSYKKNNTERAKDDYYSTPPGEVYNILTTLNYDFSNKTILEPCIGGGHMADGIVKYLEEKHCTNVKLIGTDIQDRGFNNDKWNLTYEKDFLADDYPIDKADIVIMNPPYSTLEPFIIRALEIAQDKLVVLCRTQATEGASRYEKIYQDTPFTDIYQYVDRIQCWRNGVPPTGSSAQAYCWLVWDKKKQNTNPQFHWIRRK